MHYYGGIKMRRSNPMTTYQADIILSRYESVPKQRAEMEELINLRYQGKLHDKPLRSYDDRQIYRVSERVLNEAREVKSSQQDRTRPEVKGTKQRRIDQANKHTETLVDKLAKSPAVLWGEHQRLCDYHNIPPAERPRYTISQLEALEQ